MDLKIARKLALFAIGGGSYVGLEMLYRGRSHISMFGAGGLCFVLMGRLRDWEVPHLARVGAGAGVITGVELLTGLLVNRDHHVWDYRGLPGNFRGQICPLFSALWIPVAAGAMGLYGLVDKGLNRVIAR